MKILLVITRGDTIGGAQTHVLLLAKYLKNSGYEVLTVFGGKEKGPFETLLKDNGIPFQRIHNLNNSTFSFSDFLALIKIWKTIKIFKPQVVSLHSTKVGLLCRLLSPFSKSAFVLTVHGWSFADGIDNRRAYFSATLERLLSRLIEHYIVVSKYDYELALTKRITNYQKITIVNNFLEDDITGLVNSKTSGDSLFRIVMVARFDKQKDHATLIKACSELSYVELNFVGDGPTLQEMIVLTEQLGCKSKVNFLGLRTDVNHILRQNHLFVLCSNWEGFPISTLEAMRAGLPVIVTNVGGAGECVISEVNGYVIEKGDVYMLKERIAYLWFNPDLRQQMSLNAKSLFDINYSVNNKVPEIINVFKNACS